MAKSALYVRILIHLNTWNVSDKVDAETSEGGNLPHAWVHVAKGACSHVVDYVFLPMYRHTFNV